DVTNVDQPVLLGRSPIFGTPVEMIVQNGLAVVVVADWYGALDDGTPFHGSIVRGLDATDPTNIRSVGEARLGGWGRDARVVGAVLYAVSEVLPGYCWDYGWGCWGGYYGYYGGDVPVAGGAAGVGSATTGPGGSTMKVVVSSVSFANRAVRAVGEKDYDG